MRLPICSARRPPSQASLLIRGVLAKVTAGAELLAGADRNLRVHRSGEVGGNCTAHTGTARIACRL